MVNPRLVHMDTDALIQVFITDTVAVLRNLKASYGIQPVIAPEVELEILSSRKFAGRFAAALRKAISAGTIVVLDAQGFGQLLTHDPSLQATAVGVSFAEIQSLGAAYNRRADRGESYTFAAAVGLSQPAVSNDITAIRALGAAGLALPPKVLRAYDLWVFANQIAQYTDARCDDIRKDLLAERTEFIPKAFQGCSFQDGLRKFTPRLIDGNFARIGRGHSGPDGFDSPLVIQL